MLAIIRYLFRFVRLLGSGHQAVAVENGALRRQLTAYKRKRRRPVLTQWDRLFWVGLSRVCGRCARRWSSFSPTPWSAGNSELGCHGLKEVVEEDLPSPVKSEG